MQAPPRALCWSHWLYRPDSLRCALSNPSGLSRALSGHHGPPPSQPVQTAGSWREGNGCVTPSTWPGPEGHPSCLRVRAAPARPTPWPAWKPRLRSHGWSCQRVGRGPQLVVGQDAEATGGSRASTGVRGGWGADALRIQDTDRPGAGLAAAPALTHGGHAQADGRSLGGPVQLEGMPAEEFSYDPSPDPTGPRAATFPSLGGQVLCQTDMSPGTPSASGRPPTLGVCQQDWRQTRLAK